MIETHAHIYDTQFEHDRENMLNRAFAETGITEIWMPNCNSETYESMMALADAFPQKCLPMFGLHPCYVKEDFETELQILEDHLSKFKPLAIGEIGLDLYWDKSFFEQQKMAFLHQCQLAKKYELFIDIHCREAFWETVALIEHNADAGLKGVFHCFGGSTKEVEKVIELGFLMGIGGVVTFKNGGLDKIIASIPLENIVLETDAPYLAPMPYRGKRNEPSYLKIIAQKVADLKQLPVNEVIEQTTKNALFLKNNPRMNS